MSRKGIKIPNETKLKYAKLCFENKMSRREASRQLGGDCSCVRSWVYRYREHGELAFLDTGKNRVYSDELRLQAVLSYLQGEGSQRELAAKYGLKDATQLQRWINRRIVSYVIGDHNDPPGIRDLQSGNIREPGRRALVPLRPRIPVHDQDLS